MGTGRRTGWLGGGTGPVDKVGACHQGNNISSKYDSDGHLKLSCRAYKLMETGKDMIDNIILGHISTR